MQHYRSYIRKYWPLFTLSIMMLVIEAGVDLTLPLFIASMIDDGVANRDMDVIVRLGSYMLLLTGVGATAALIRNYVSSRVSQQFGTELRGDLFRSIQGMPLASLDKFERASLITRLTNDVTQLQNFVNGLMRIFVRAPMLAIGSVIMAVRLDAELAVVVLIVVPVVALIIAVSIRIGYHRFVKVQQALDTMNIVVREYLSGVRVVKAFNRFDYETTKFGEANDEYGQRSIRVMRLMSVFNPMVMLTLNAGIVAVLWIGGMWVESGRLQVGVIIAFINYMTQILFSLMLISMVFMMFIRAKASASRITEVFAEASSAAHASESVASSGAASTAFARPAEGAGGWKEGDGAALSFEGVTFAYEGASAPALRNVSFDCLPGQTVAVIGSTGSGKTTLVALIPRFYEATEGVVRVGGVDVGELDPRELRGRIAVVPQKTMLFTGTIADNLRWGKQDATVSELEQAATLAAAHDFISALPEGYDTQLGRQGVNLSGGQKQRVSIARALIRQPDILILDDCTSAVDTVTEASIRRGIQQYAGKLTCLIIAQRITSVMDADKIVVMNEGEVADVGRHDDLLERSRIYREIYDSQIGRGADPA